MIGKGILIVVLGISAILSFMMISLNSNANAGTQVTVDFFDATQARLIANSGVEIFLEKMRRNKSLKGNFTDNELMDGEYDIYIYGPDSALTIKCVATFQDVTHTSKVTAKRSGITMPEVNSSIYVSADNLALNLNGNIDIDGNDHLSDGSPGPNPSLPGIAVDDPTDSAFIVDNLKPKISSSIKGLGGSPSVTSISDGTDWMKLTENIIFAADITLPSGTYASGTVLGTTAEPKITYASGDVDFSGSAEGSGILVVNGNLTLSGNFTFKGIIIAYGSSSIVTRTVGNAGIYGATIFVGQSVDLQATGNALLYYSKQAIDNASANLKSSRFEILTWWE